MVERRDNIHNGNIEKPEKEANEVLYTAEIDVLEEAIAKFNEERFQKVREELKKGVETIWH